jgi:hypothetical protein
MALFGYPPFRPSFDREAAEPAGYFVGFRVLLGRCNTRARARRKRYKEEDR